MNAQSPNDSAESAKESAKDAARSAERSAPVRALARGGVAVVGLLHIIIGAIAISVATGAGGGEADQSGALHQLAKTPGGTIVLWSVVIGMLALIVWQLLEVFLMPITDEKRKWAKRVVEFGKAVAYVIIGFTAFTFARGSYASSEDATQAASALLLSAPGGVILLAVIGVVVIITGGSFVFRGISTNFTSDIRVPPSPYGAVVVTLGVIGYVAKGLIIGVAGAMVVYAAFTTDSDKAAGLDGAIKSIAGLPFGNVILFATGVGLIAYGVFFLVRARLVRL
ncbi:DUF1206 domain-containing protein [Glaciibacter superstes]|uniref:DUF1206 domain-containing protein n=1 Tax=Glaciibacter superstes TaxID=501023 RepID=UPI0003B36CD6|nr:DUF1206 domain-containing protein [Glaciibacter superstes]